MQLEAKLQQHMDCEDRRVKELTESILYDFLPAALNVMLPMCEDPLQELDADRCRVGHSVRWLMKHVLRGGAASFRPCDHDGSQLRFSQAINTLLLTSPLL